MGVLWLGAREARGENFELRCDLGGFHWILARAERERKRRKKRRESGERAESERRESGERSKAERTRREE